MDFLSLLLVPPLLPLRFRFLPLLVGGDVEPDLSGETEGVQKELEIKLYHSPLYHLSLIGRHIPAAGNIGCYLRVPRVSHLATTANGYIQGTVGICKAIARA